MEPRNCGQDDVKAWSISGWYWSGVLWDGVVGGKGVVGGQNKRLFW